MYTRLMSYEDLGHRLSIIQLKKLLGAKLETRTKCELKTESRDEISTTDSRKVAMNKHLKISGVAVLI